MKKILALMFLGVLVLTLAACEVKTSSSFGLTVQKAVLAKEDRTGKVVPVPDAVYKRGDTIFYVLVNTGKFKKGEDGFNSFDIDMLVNGPDGSVLIEKKGILGEGGHIKLDNDIAPSPHGILTTSTKLKPGRYKIKLNIYDKIGKGSASESTSFILE